MSMDVGGGKKGARSDINVTPLIDVVLVLLIIFMVLVPSMLKHHTANVPRKSPPNQPPPPPTHLPIVVEYTAKGELSVNSEVVSPEGLASAVSDRLKGRRNKVVFFKVEDDAPYGTTVRFMDIVKGAGAEKLGIVTKEEQ